MDMAQIKRGLKKCIQNPWHAFVYIDEMGLLKRLDDEKYLRLMYRAWHGKKLNLDHPTTFTEKLQWLKLYNRKPEYSRMVDKYEAKLYIAERIGEEHVIPTYGVWNSFDDIDFSALPNSFVLKCTHDCGSIVICKDKSKLDIAKAREIINRSMQRNYYTIGREWPYKDVKPRIIAEKYMENITADGKKDECLTDYKFFCFGGAPKVVYVSKDKAADPRTNFFDMDFNVLPIRMRDPNSEIPPEKPTMFEEMKRIAAVLSQGHPHLRVDFYQIDGRLYIGELTFFHCGGFCPVKPDEWNRKMGEWIQLPEKTAI